MKNSPRKTPTFRRSKIIASFSLITLLTVGCGENSNTATSNQLNNKASQTVPSNKIAPNTNQTTPINSIKLTNSTDLNTTVNSKPTSSPIIIASRSFETDTRTIDRDMLGGLNPIISRAPITCTPKHKLIKLGPDCDTIKQPDYYTADNTTWIDAQVYVPEHNKGDKLPVIVHSHGYGSSKLSELKEIPFCDNSKKPYNCPLGENQGFERFQGMFEQTDRMITELVEEGYVVVSYSQRGFGKSEGDIMLMNPYHETQDGMAVLDWIAKQGKNGNLPIDVDNNNDFKVGLLGGSYGGGFQFPLAALDTRIDTMIPIGTWNTVSRSIVPNGVTKGGWGNLLCMMSIGKHQHHYLREACTKMSLPTIRTEAKLDRHKRLMPYINQSGLGYFEYLEKNNLPFREGNAPFKMRAIDTLLIQGLRDVLFDGEEGTRNYEYLKAAGGDVRMLTNQSGHISPFANQNSAGTMNCGETDMFRAMRVWFDVKLRDKPDSLLDEIPQVCMSLDNQTAINLDEVPAKENSTVITKPFNIEIGNLRGPIKCEAVHEITTDNTVLAGRVQLSNLIVTDDTLVHAGVGYLGLCLKREGKETLIDDVLTGYPAGTHEASNFVTVAEKLQNGDVIGVMAVKDHVQMFAFGPSAVPNFSALVLQGFKPGDHKNSDFVDSTLPGSNWASVGLFSINAFTVKGEISLPIFEVEESDLSVMK